MRRAGPRFTRKHRDERERTAANALSLPATLLAQTLAAVRNRGSGRSDINRLLLLAWPCRWGSDKWRLEPLPPCFAVELDSALPHGADVARRCDIRSRIATHKEEIGAHSARDSAAIRPPKHHGWGGGGCAERLQGRHTSLNEERELGMQGGSGAVPGCARRCPREWLRHLREVASARSSARARENGAEVFAGMVVLSPATSCQTATGALGC